MRLGELIPSHDSAILLICDQAYLPAARFVSAQLLTQALLNFDIVVMTLDCTPESQALFDPQAKVVDVEPGAELRSFTHSARKSTATYFRLGAIEKLRGMYHKVLYLDCDVWIGRRALGRLFDLDLDDYEIAAVRDAAEILRPGSSEWTGYRKNLGLPKDTPYFNTGVLLVNVEKFCSSAIGRDAIAYLSAGKYRGSFHDQSALNAILAGRWLEISPIWNWTFGTRERMTQRYDPAVIHFIGSNKPWKDRKAKHHSRYRMEMRKYLSAHSAPAYVEPVPAHQQWRRLAVNCIKDAKTLLLGDQRDNNIDRFMASTRFADVEAGIVDPSWLV